MEERTATADKVALVDRPPILDKMKSDSDVTRLRSNTNSKIIGTTSSPIVSSGSPNSHSKLIRGNSIASII